MERHINRAAALIVLMAGAGAAGQPPALELASPFEAVVQPVEAPGVRRLRFDPQAFAAFDQVAAGGQAFQVTGLALPGRTANLVLQQFNVTAPGFRAEIVGERGSRFVVPRVRTLVGAIQGEPSLIFLAVAPGQVNGFVLDGAGRTLMISTGDPRGATGVITIADSAAIGMDAGAKPWICQVPDWPAPEPPPQPAGAGSSGPQVRIADMFVDGDNNFRALFATAEDAVDYVVTLWAAGSSIFRRDVGVAFRLPDGYVRVWEAVPPWGDNGINVSEYQAWWQSDGNPLQALPRAAAHLLTAPAHGGVAAAIGGVCSIEVGYATSGLNGFFPIPLQHTSSGNWDPVVVFHEYGHIFGSMHTQLFVPPIACNDGSGPDNGTIMSYCHQQPGGIANIGLRFHARCQHAIRAFVEPGDCFEVVIVELGDYDFDGDRDAADLLSCQVCVDLEFEALGCLETFDLDGDGALSSCDYALLEAIVDPMKQPSDCNGNSVPDSCEDCTGNGLADECDIAKGTSTDCDGDGVADECQALHVGDCDGNGTSDYCDIVAGSLDADANGVPDQCQSFLVVPSASYPTIQSAIDAAAPGDTVMLLAGVFTGPGNRDLDFYGKIATVRGATGPAASVIDAQGLGRGFVFQSGESSATRVEHVTIINGSATLGAGVLVQGASSPTLLNVTLSGNGSLASTVSGGGIACVEASAPTLLGCTISANSAGTGGGVYCGQSSPHLLECTIEDNNAASRGGGIGITTGNPIVARCTIRSNSSNWGGGVACMIGGEPAIQACTISGNSADELCGGAFFETSHPRLMDCLIHANTSLGDAGGIGAYISANALLVNCTFVDNLASDGTSHDAQLVFSSATLSNCILWGEAAGTRVMLSYGSATYVDHCIVSGGIAGIGLESPKSASPLVWGPGNLDTDPMFADRGAGDFSLVSGSPAIDAGAPDFMPEPGQTDLGGGPRLVDGDGDGTALVDIGADEWQGCPTDLNGDGATGILDFLMLLVAWGPNPAHPADLDGDGHVRIEDFLLLLSSWGDCR